MITARVAVATIGIIAFLSVVIIAMSIIASTAAAVIAPSLWHRNWPA